MGDGVPRVSVVVAARNAAATLDACLRSLLALCYPDVEIIVVDDGSADDTPAIAERHPVRRLTASGRGPSAARNAGIEAATGSIVAFTDADCTVDAGWLEALVPALSGERVGSAGGLQINAVGGDRTARSALVLSAFFRLASLVSDYTRTSGQPRDVRHNASCNSAYWRPVLLAAGGFRVGLWPGEDVDLDLRVRRGGHRCVYVPGAVVVHHRPASVQWLAGMMRRYGHAQGRLVRLHGPFRLLHGLPIALAGWVALQAGWFSATWRPVVVVVDLATAAAALVALGLAAPIRLWLDVARSAARSILAWHLGLVGGLLRGEPAATPHPGSSPRPGGSHSN